MRSLVTGEILLSKKIDSFTDAVANIYLEDVSRLDAPAKIVTKQTITSINHQEGTETGVAFLLRGGEINVRARYSIRVHVTFHSDEQIHCGDYISTQSYPVLTHGCPRQVLVAVSRVK